MCSPLGKSSLQVLHADCCGSAIWLQHTQHCTPENCIWLIDCLKPSPMSPGWDVKTTHLSSGEINYKSEPRRIVSLFLASLESKAQFMVKESKCPLCGYVFQCRSYTSKFSASGFGVSQDSCLTVHGEKVFPASSYWNKWGVCALSATV